MRKNLSVRKYVFFLLFVVIGLTYALRLLSLQVLDDKYVLSANNNVLRKITQYPTRGMIYDRNNKLLVYDEAAYDLMVVPAQVGDIDTAKLCDLINISNDDFLKKMEKARKHSRFKPSVFQEQISKENYGYLEEVLYRFPGFFVVSRSLRKYSSPVAAHVLGYVGEVNKREIEKDPYYVQGDYIGKSGIEKAYEKYLRGSKGQKVIMVDVLNREQGSFKNGKYDTASIGGTDLTITIDLELQEFGEQLMEGKVGSIVAIEPSSGEILALVSSPYYDPNLLIGRVRSDNYNKLSKDTLKPLYNRATMAAYPPGSTFKPLMALLACEEGAINPGTAFTCQGPLTRPIKCTHNHVSPLKMREAIEQSCNPYFWNVFRSMISKYPDTEKGYDVLRNHLLSCGFGAKFENDIINQRSGNIPEIGYYDHYFGKGRWSSLTIRSLAIGQGELLITPLQLANMSAIIANQGYYFTPHLIKSIKSDEEIPVSYREKKSTMINAEHFDAVIDGMHRVYTGDHGTARWYAIDSIEICGKTGTAENPHGEDHSVFVAFAPKSDPQIAISVIVENGGYGSKWGAPIASLMIEKYLKREVSESWFLEKMLNEKLIAIE